MSKLVTIIIPTYNYAVYVSEAVNSVLSQTYQNLEVIVIDDGSTDNTKDVLSDYIKTGKIHYIYKENKGLAAARNTGIRNAKGDYICFLDSDDLIEGSKIQVQVDCLEEHMEYGVSFSDFRFFRGSDLSNLIPAHVKYNEKLNFSNVIRGEFMPVHAALIRRDVIDRIGLFDETLRKCEDYDFWIRVAMAGIRFFYIDQVLAYYRLHSEQMVQDKIGLSIAYIDVINRYKEFDPVSACYALSKYGTSVGKQMIYAERKEEGRRFLLKYMRYKKSKVVITIPLLILSYIFPGKMIKAMVKFINLRGN